METETNRHTTGRLMHCWQCKGLVLREVRRYFEDRQEGMERTQTAWESIGQTPFDGEHCPRCQSWIFPDNQDYSKAHGMDLRNQIAL